MNDTMSPSIADELAVSRGSSPEPVSDHREEARLGETASIVFTGLVVQKPLNQT
jgi:hypothetical protein